MVTEDKVWVINQQRLTIADIRIALSGLLPGVEAQAKMAPQPARGIPHRWDIPNDCREAGVLLLLYAPTPTAELHIVMMRRPEYPGTHGGQVSLPGGRREAGETMRQTALRETMEEIGLSPETLEIIGRLSPLYIPPSHFCTYPYVAYSPAHPHFQPDEKEVAEIIETPLSLLLDPTIRQAEMWQFPEIGERRIPFFDVFGHQVWGATAMILIEFLTLLEEKIITK